MPGNEHFGYALDALGDRRNSPEAAATLALTYEQRTANMIAFHTHLVSTGQLTAVAARLADQIYERLGF